MKTSMSYNPQRPKHSLFHQPSLIFMLVIFPSLIELHKPTKADELTHYDECYESFECANVPNLGYPFYDGDKRPDYCGYPGFEVNCSGTMPEITLNTTQSYYLLDYTNDKTLHTISVAREDYWDNYCPTEPTNTTMNFSLFSYTSADINYTFGYQCSGEVPTEYHQFPCPGGDSFGYAVPPAGPWGLCQNYVLVPVNDSFIPSLANPKTMQLQAVFRSGFELEWFAENDNCDVCLQSGGACGYNTSMKKFRCYCGYDVHDIKCDVNHTGPDTTNKQSGKSSKKTGVIAGAAAGGVSFAALVAVFSLFIMRRRRRSRLQPQVQSKDLHPSRPSSGLLSSNGFRYSEDSATSPSTNQSHSIPSYPSSSSDFKSASFYYGVKVFSYAELEEATQNFNESRELGDGGFGTVYYGELRDGRRVAVKRLYESSCRRMGQFLNEIQILARLSHKNLVALHGCSSKRSKELLLVYEYIPNGTVADHLHGKLAVSNTLPWSTRLSIAVETAEALVFLHKSDVIHRDVKTANILLDNDFQVKVADFGLSRLFPDNVTHVSTAPQGTPGYVDPDYYKCYHLTEKSDVYSFGVVLVELISSKPAVDITRHRHDINLSNMATDRIRKNALNELVDPDLGYDKDYVVQKMVKSVAELAFQCIQEDREMRPCMEDVLKSLRAIQKETMNSQNQVVVDIQECDDDTVLLKNVSPPLSPETKVNDQRVR